MEDTNMACPLFHKHNESLHPIFLNCEVVRSLWLNCYWWLSSNFISVLPGTILYGVPLVGIYFYMNINTF